MKNICIIEKSVVMNIDEYWIKIERRQLKESGAKPFKEKPLPKHYGKKKKKVKKKSGKEKISKHKQKYLDYLNSDEWAQIKIDLYEIRGKRCEKCFSKREIQVHHLHYRNLFFEEPEDLILLCRKCHIKEHS